MPTWRREPQVAAAYGHRNMPIGGQHEVPEVASLVTDYDC
jgi:hypothetical protein